MKTFIAFIFSFALASHAFAQSYYSAPTTGTAGASAQVLAANAKRTYLIIQNTGATSLCVKFGSTISSSECIVVPAGGNYEMTEAPAQSVWIKAVSGSPTYVVIQGN